ncbi:hypothetical protein LPJ66_008254 [Kickxella alabastrina]|uniref:Uncharacterized protein n=1 Tax=Kickxella alabastrina TaxID=61397 RepID=A0ACC1I8Y1_9FUNG|nr:hypothetical protein LPJ66_008254 [Kickxella alabastrina]
MYCRHAKQHGSASRAALLDAGALVQSQNIEGATPLHFAAYYGHKDAVRCLLSVNSSAINIKDNTGKTPLMLAAFRGRTQVVSVLLSVGGGQINEQDNAGWTALMYAAFTGRIAICREMLEFVASRIIADYKTGKSAADLAQEAGYYEVADMLQNKEVALRTPSLPEHINMPTARPLPYAVTTNPLHPAAERAVESQAGY